MTRKSRFPSRFCALLAAVALPTLLAGCHHRTRPEPVVSRPVPVPTAQQVAGEQVPSEPAASRPDRDQPVRLAHYESELRFVPAPGNGSAEQLPPHVAPGSAPDLPVGAASKPETPDVQSIDLPTALRLASAQNPEIALARERINEALAQQNRAEVLWLPTMEFAPNWTRHDGPIQRSVGEVLDVSRSAAFVGGGPTWTVGLSDAIYAPLAARQISAARRAGAVAVSNDQLLAVAIAYVDLLQAYAEQQINEETLRNAQVLLQLTESYERAGKGAPADTARSRTEVFRRQRQSIELQGRNTVASARLVQLLNLPPRVDLRPLEPAVVPIALVPEDLPLDELLVQAVANRPELAENRALIAATVAAWRNAKAAPFYPSLRVSYSAGGFGGGPNDFFGDFGVRSDVTAGVVWQLQSLGLGNAATVRERRSQNAQATFRQASLETRVANEVVSAFTVAYALRRQLNASQQEVASARESYRLNEDRIRRAPEQGRPIELLQSVQALAQARSDYLAVVAGYDRAQFRLYTALGNPPLSAIGACQSLLPDAEPVPPPPDHAG